MSFDPSHHTTRGNLYAVTQTIRYLYIKENTAVSGYYGRKKNLFHILSFCCSDIPFQFPLYPIHASGRGPLHSSGTD